jgi:hypothetical protein
MKKLFSKYNFQILWRWRLRGLQFEASPGKKISETPILKKTLHQNGLVEWLKV